MKEKKTNNLLIQKRLSVFSFFFLTISSAFIRTGKRTTPVLYDFAIVLNFSL